ncbi:TPA: outer membrane protein assembly factor BamE [Klebsiella pneumoniae]
MNKTKWLLPLLCTILLSGCAGVGNEHLKKETEVSIKTKITEGVTTKEQVRSQFGSPDTTTFTDNGKEIWKYEYTNMSADAVNYIPIVNFFGSSSSGTKKELVIMFDGDKVSRYSMAETASSVKTGAFR